MLTCAPDASNEIIRQKFDRILSTANLVNDKEILQFLDVCAKKFAHMLTE
jgi:cell division septum initiation protein DivIVA